MTEDLTFQALRQLKANPQLSQRQLAKALGSSTPTKVIRASQHMSMSGVPVSKPNSG